jgi:hypothetical protein
MTFSFLFGVPSVFLQAKTVLRIKSCESPENDERTRSDQFMRDSEPAAENGGSDSELHAVSPFMADSLEDSVLNLITF